MQDYRSLYGNDMACGFTAINGIKRTHEAGLSDMNWLSSPLLSAKVRDVLPMSPVQNILISQVGQRSARISEQKS